MGYIDLLNILVYINITLMLEEKKYFSTHKFWIGYKDIDYYFYKTIKKK